MTITKIELEKELNSLKLFGLTQDELEGYVEFYKDNLTIKRIRIINTKRKINSENNNDIIQIRS